MYKIAVVEDDIELSNIIYHMLKKYGYEAANQFNYRNLTEDILNYHPNLILLDINLPYFDGYHIARELRQKSHIPIIMISARDTEAEQIRGFDMGADDYIVKPFSMDMLKVKMNACLRRVYESSLNENDNITVGNLSINKKTFTLSYNHQEIELTKNEFKIISALVENYGTIVRRDFLLNELWDDMTFVEDNTLNVNISRIKSKLESLGLKNVIRVKRGEGYLFHMEVEKP